MVPERCTDDPMTTADVVASMLKENTGTALCDSGGEMQADGTFKYGYGRHWQRNIGRDFSREQPSWADFRHGEVNFGLSTYHFLCDKLEFNQELDDLFQRFVEEMDNPDKEPKHSKKFWKEVCDRYSVPWLSYVEEFPNYLRDLRKDDSVAGIYGDGNPCLVYTYNEENFLDQDIQFLYWEDIEGAHALVQTHNGCDARGGMSMPRVFDVCDELGIFDYKQGYIGCNACEASWHSDDGYSWYGSNGEPDLYGGYRNESNAAIEDLSEFFDSETWVEADADGDDKEVAESLWRTYEKMVQGGMGIPPLTVEAAGKAFLAVVKQIREVLPDHFAVYATSEGRGSCPICGEGCLSA